MKTLIGVIAASLLGVVALATPAQAAPAPVPVAHRGGTEAFTENTRKAWNHAMANGARWVETDVQFTKDNQPVIMHDLTVDRTTNGTGTVASMTLTQLRVLRTDDGQYVPTLYEFLTDLKAFGAKALVELKVTPTSKQWTEFHKRFDWLGMRQNTVIISGKKECLPLVKSMGYQVGWIDELGDRDPAEITPYADYYIKHHWSVTTERYKKWTAAGLKVFPWTPNQTVDWDRFKVMGVPGVITDKPVAFKVRVGS